MGAIKNVAIVVLVVIICVSIPIHPVSADEIPIVSRGEPFTITATLLSNGTTGEPLSEQIVYFFDQTMNILMTSTKTDSNGVASLDYTFPTNHPLGNTLLNITFRGNTSLALAPTCQWFTLILTSLTNIETHITKTELAPNDILEFTTHLTDDAANPMELANITILCDNIPILITQTNETGYASISIPLSSSSFSLGPHTIEARYEGDSIQFYRGISSSFEIEINRLSTDIDLVTSTGYTTMLTHTWNATLKVMTEEGHIELEQAHILVNGIYYDSTTIDQEGYIRYNFLINQSFSIGEHTITFEYPGNERYDSSFIDVEIRIGSPLHLNITPLGPAEIGQDLHLKIMAQDVYLRPITNGTIEIRDTSTNQSILENLSDQTEKIIQFPIFGDRGPRTLRIEVTHEDLLENNTIFLRLDIWTKPKINIISSNIKGFASPRQTLIIDITLQDYRGLIPDKNLLFRLSNANENSSITTRIDGSARIEVESPISEGFYFLYIFYEGNQSEFELPSHGMISFTVSQSIPTEVTLQDYEVITSLSLILVKLQIHALNGSYIEGVLFQYNWISAEGNYLSGTNGLIELNLPIPSTSGIHSLSYQIEPTKGLQACSGVIYLITTSEDANASEGIGFYGLFLGFTSSIGLSTITVARRRLIIG